MAQTYRESLLNTTEVLLMVATYMESLLNTIEVLPNDESAPDSHFDSLYWVLTLMT